MTNTDMLRYCYTRPDRPAMTVALEISAQGDKLAEDAEMLKMSDELHVPPMIYDARTAAGLAQKELAKAVGTPQSVISQLESAEHKGHSLSMLERIGEALNMRVEAKFVPLGIQRLITIMARPCNHRLIVPIAKLRSGSFAASSSAVWDVP